MCDGSHFSARVGSTKIKTFMFNMGQWSFLAVWGNKEQLQLYKKTINTGTMTWKAEKCYPAPELVCVKKKSQPIA